MLVFCFFFKDSSSFVSVAGFLGYDVLVNLTDEQIVKTEFQLLVF
ncbi:hypothetical protein THERMOS_2328 [Bathymodiolus thermophilus thioautotrophic gill symbiont]|uniref:Uncharacterized protein n=1 Tax=Bathymodiolus thermophilus thioautotrophic gill symbiont TaxID=2360 RepID=A0A8H8XGH8_9GAMM|nr:hypothetical protein THERMOS_2328 [Bathymodiolus thermophilus thioautotrophic gill symbiont]